MSGCGTHRADVRLVVSGGAVLGLGHVARAVTLAEAALERGLRPAISLRGDASAFEMLAKALPGVPVAPWHCARDAVRHAQWVVLDTREPVSHVLAAARRAGAGTVVVDRVDALERADVTLLPIPHPPELTDPRLLGGPAWCMRPRALRALEAAPERAPRDRILVSFGGADPLDLTTRTAAPLARALAWLPEARRLPVDVVLGPGFADREGCAARLAELGWRVHGPLDRTALWRLARRAVAAVVGYGTSVYDLAALGVPSLYWTHHREDLEPAARLERAGVGALAGFGGRVDARVFRSRLAHTVLDPDWRAEVAVRGRAAVGDGWGAERLLDLLAGTPQLVAEAHA